MRDATLAWRRNVLAVTAATFIGFTGFTLVMPFLPIFIRELGVSDVGEIALWTGAILGVTPGLTAVMAPFWGRLSDRFGRKIMVVRSLTAASLVMAGIAFVTNPWQMLALRCALGLLTGYGPLALTMAAESAPRAQMASAIGLVQTAQRLGPAVGPVIGGALARLLGLRATFLVTAGFYAAALVLVLVMYSEPRRDASGQEERAGVSIKTALTLENFVLLMAVVFGLQFVDRSVGPILPLYVEQVGVDRAQIPLIAGLLFSAMAVTGAFGHHFCRKLLQRFTPRSVLSGAAAMAAVGAGLVGLNSNVWILTGAVAVFGGGIGAALTAAYTAAGAVIPAGAHGTGFGILSSASLTGFAVSPVIAGVIGAASLRSVFLLDVLILAALATVVWRVFAQPAEPATPVVGGT